MTDKGRKIDARAVIKKALRAKEKKRNITYRIDTGLLDRFTEALKDQDVSGNQVIETMIRDFVESFEHRRK